MTAYRFQGQPDVKSASSSLSSSQQSVSKRKKSVKKLKIPIISDFDDDGEQYGGKRLLGIFVSIYVYIYIYI